MLRPLLVAVLMLALPVTRLGAADEPHKPAPPGPAPAEPPKPSDPPEPPDPDDPPPEEPKPEEPSPADAEEARRKAAEAEEAKREAEEEAEKKRREAERKAAEEDDGAVRPPVPEPPRPGPGGMRYVPAGEAVIGTKAAELSKLVGNRPPEIRRVFDYERPQHTRPMPDYWLDTHELTNAQYEVFLKEHLTSYTCDGKLPTLVDVVGDLLKLPEPTRDDVAWRQLAETNKDALQKALPNVDWPQGFKTAILPKRDLVLVFTRRRPPDDWPSVNAPVTRLDHPVRNVSCLDGEAFFEWAGKHMQSEFEYEYAARGPEGWELPWGRNWKTGIEYCNWGAKNVDPKTHEADTWPVGSHPKGRSWVDVHDLLGNVAEWTASWFEPYPLGNQEHDFLRAVHVIRGGTAVDVETLVLRAAARNFVGTGFNAAPPYPQNRYMWVGHRGAWWFKAGANQAPFVAARIYRGGRLKAVMPTPDPNEPRPPGLDLERMAGTVAENFVAPGVVAPHAVYVLGRSRAVLAIPRTFVLDAEDKSDGAPNANRAKSKVGLLKESESPDPLILLGAFHTDATLSKVWVRVKIPPPANEEERRQREKDKEKRRGRSESPAVEEGTCNPGSYIVALWHSRLCLVDESREFKCFVTAPDKAPNLDVKKLKSDEVPPACKVSSDAELGTISASLSAPLAFGNGSDPLLWVVASFSVEASSEELESPNGWR